MLSINTNISSLITQRSMKTATNLLNQAVERMSTGYKVNHAKDNAAAYSIITNMDTKIGAYQVAEDNCAMGLDMITTANESLSLISDKLSRLRDLATQASNGTYGEQSKKAINSEANALVDEMYRLYSTAEYNGMKLFNNSESIPATASFAMRVASPDYSQITMTSLTQAYEAGVFVEGETYSIKDKAELLKFAEMVNNGNSGAGSTFVLTDDIDLSGVEWTPIGYSEDCSLFFSGVFDGNGKVISHLTINETNALGQGLFGVVASSDIDNYVELKNIGLEDVNIIGGNCVGGLAGYIVSLGEVNISNNYVTGSVRAEYTVGGLVGQAAGEGGTISLSNNYSNCTVNAPSGFAAGFLGYIYSDSSTILLNNNYATGTVSGGGGAGGFASVIQNYSGNVSLNSNYATGAVSGTDSVGGFVGLCENKFSGTLEFSNNYTTGAVSGTDDVGGFIGEEQGDACIYTNNASVVSNTYGGSGITQMTAAQIKATYTPEMMGFSEANGWKIVNGVPIFTWQFASSASLNGSNQVSLQVGIGSDISSQICLEVGFSLGTIDDFRLIGIDTTTDFLSMIDNMLSVVNAKEVEYGAVQNRLDSALNEISTQYENLVSSRSTLRDADIAEVSSQYIQQQILQQASATLMATANQMPSIALQLI